MERFQVIVDPELEPIMDRYLELRRKELDQLETALRSKDSDTVTRLGHNLRGSGSSYGFDRLTELGEALEAAGRDGLLDRAGELARAIGEYLENMDIVYGK